MPKNTLKDKAYYWVRRHPSTSGEAANPTHHHPNWEPMLWDADKQAFYQRGSLVGHAVTALAKVGDMIQPQGDKRVTRKGWLPVRFRRGSTKAEVVYDEVHLSRSAATRSGRGLPLRCEISWSHQDQLDADKFTKSLHKHTTKKS